MKHKPLESIVKRKFKRHSFHLELKTPNGRQSAVFDIWGESTELSQSQISYVEKGVILKSLI